jgi:hypothetical protein
MDAFVVLSEGAMVVWYVAHICQSSGAYGAWDFPFSAVERAGKCFVVGTKAALPRPISGIATLYFLRAAGAYRSVPSCEAIGAR